MEVSVDNCKVLCQGKESTDISIKWRKAVSENSLFEKYLKVFGIKSMHAKGADECNHGHH